MLGVGRGPGSGAQSGAHADGVDVRLVAGECLPTGPLPHIPELGAGVTGPRNEEFEVRGDSQTHAVPCVSHKHGLLLPSLNVPQSTARGVGGCHTVMERPGRSRTPSPGTHSVLSSPSGVPGAGHNVVVVQEAAARQITWGW